MANETLKLEIVNKAGGLKEFEAKKYITRSFTAKEKLKEIV